MSTEIKHHYVITFTDNFQDKVMAVYPFHCLFFTGHFTLPKTDTC